MWSYNFGLLTASEVTFFPVLGKIFQENNSSEKIYLEITPPEFFPLGTNSTQKKFHFSEKTAE